MGALGSWMQEYQTCITICQPQQGNQPDLEMPALKEGVGMDSREPPSLVPSVMVREVEMNPSVLCNQDRLHVCGAFLIYPSV